MAITTTCSGGGPVIAVPAELAATWRGTLAPIGVEVPPGWTWGSGDIECDYDRACDSQALNDFEITPYGGVGWLTVGEGAALILDSELVTAWVPDPAGGYIIRNWSDDQLDEASARRHVEAAEAAGWRELSLVWELRGTVYLFDSAYAGAAQVEDIKAFDGVAVGELAPGRYRVWAATTADEVDVVRIARR
ncbi:MAG TPA: Imm21 family immunity protein [Enhygromyxa sp.]|nr:Imm21 family immunity protein [Enhygromyxa sp.]